MNHKTHYETLRKYLPRGYRKDLAEKTGVSESLVDQILRNLRSDTSGVLKEAYRIALQNQIRIETNSIELDNMQRQLERLLA